MKLYMYHDKCMHAYTPGTSGRCVCLLIAKTSKPLAAHWQRALSRVERGREHPFHGISKT